MEGRRAAVVGALGVAVLLGAIAVWRVKAGSAPPPPASTGSPRAPLHDRTAGGQDTGRRAPPALPKAAPAPPPGLPASAYEPMIDLPAPPPPEEGAGDDFLESGLPRSIFDGKIKLERLSPSPARLEAARARLGRDIQREAQEELLASFRRHDEAAAAAIGYFRLRELSEAQAVAAIARELEGYRKEAAAALGVRSDEVERLLAEPGSPR